MHTDCVPSYQILRKKSHMDTKLERVEHNKMLIFSGTNKVETLACYQTQLPQGKTLNVQQIYTLRVLSIHAYWSSV